MDNNPERIKQAESDCKTDIKALGEMNCPFPHFFYDIPRQQNSNSVCLLCKRTSWTIHDLFLPLEHLSLKRDEKKRDYSSAIHFIL